MGNKIINQIAKELHDMVIDAIAAEIHDLMIGDQAHAYSLYANAPEDVRIFYRKVARWHLNRLQSKVAEAIDLIREGRFFDPADLVYYEKPEQKNEPDQEGP